MAALIVLDSSAVVTTTDTWQAGCPQEWQQSQLTSFSSKNTSKVWSKKTLNTVTPGTEPE
jgi:hypothetical protein